MSHNLHVFVEHHFSTTNRSYITLDWILDSYHPDDVITISSSSLIDLDHDDIFLPPPAKEVLKLICNIKDTYTRHSRSLTALAMTLIVQEVLKSHQSNLAATLPTSSPDEHTVKDHETIKLK